MSRDLAAGKVLSLNAAAACLALASMLISGAAARGQWEQWGGPNQDFKVESAKLADEWPDKGPKKLWSKTLGEGYSAILVNDGMLYTMYRTKAKGKGDTAKPGRETVVALKASNGKVAWKHSYEAVVGPGHAKEFGVGPRATPLVDGGRLYTIGVTGVMHCLNKKDGKVIWSHNLLKDFGGSVLPHGYSSSPVVYGDLVIALVGGPGHAVMAFNKADGEVVWQKHDYMNSYSTPKLIRVDGEDQVVCFMADELVGLDPKTGDQKWRVPHQNQWKQNITLPIWDEKAHLLFITSSPDPRGGGRGLRLTRKEGKTEVEQVWANKKVAIHHSNAVQVGDYVYTSSGGRGPGLFYAVNILTGEIAWKERGFSKANCVYADGRFIILDEDGNLGMAVCTPEGFEIKASVPLLKKSSWTVPTLVGKVLYVRDQKKIMALDLG
jgi:outer membrane protein assembly factor BamB